MRKIRTLVSEHFRKSTNNNIKELPRELATDDNINVSYSIGDYFRTSNDSLDHLNDLINSTDDELEKSIEEVINRTPIEDCEYWRRYFTEKQLTKDFPFEEKFDRETCKRLYMLMKEKIVKAYSEIMFSTLSLHKIERMMILNDWLYSEEEVEL